jgi:hypothetical protein
MEGVMDLVGVAFGEDELAEGERIFTIHDRQTGKNYAIIASQSTTAEQVRPLLLDWLEAVRKAA